MSIARQVVAAFVVLVLVWFPTARAASYDQGAFLQYGDGDSKTMSATFGYVHAFRSIESQANSPWDFYGEASLGRWFARGGDHHGEYTQIGLTPVVRYVFTRGGIGWFAEIGVGANVITPRFQSGDRRFSTTFNFGDHLGVGARFGENLANEIALRFQHYSNAGIRSPNPGEDFVQVRYTRHF